MVHIPSCWGLRQLSGGLLNHPSETYLYIYCYVTMSFYIHKVGMMFLFRWICFIYSLIFRICSCRSHNLYQELAKQHGKYGNEVAELISRTKAPIGIRWFLVDFWCFLMGIRWLCESWWGRFQKDVDLSAPTNSGSYEVTWYVAWAPMAKRCSPRIWSWKNIGSASEMVNVGRFSFQDLPGLVGIVMTPMTSYDILWLWDLWGNMSKTWHPGEHQDGTWMFIMFIPPNMVS
jgi:hypothetical protein